MMLDDEELCKRAANLETESNKIRFDPPFVSALEVLLLDVYGNTRPRPSDYEERTLLVEMFNTMAKDIFGSSSGFPTMEVFGSFIMDLFTARSDLDLSLNFSNDYATDFTRENKIPILRKFAKSLYAHQRQGKFSGVSPIVSARVPVLKVVDCRTRIECDISVENKDGMLRSSILKIISSMDERFLILCYLMKLWAKAHDLNSSKDHTMNSLAIISLVALHMQTRDPPILPPFSTLFEDGTDVSSVEKVVLGFSHFSKRNEESISKLFVALLCKLSSVESLWEHGLCASAYDGRWTSKTWKSKVANMSVEDFLDRNQNVARSVGEKEMRKINDCIRGSLNHLSRFMESQIEASELKSLLFGSIPMNFPTNQLIPIKEKRRKNPRKKKLPKLPGSAPRRTKPAKRTRHSKATGELQQTSRSILFDLPGSAAAPPNPIPAKRAQASDATGEVHRYYSATPANNPLPEPSIPLRPSFAPPRTSYQVQYRRPSSVPSLSGHVLQHHPQPQVTPRQTSYQVHHLGPSVPSQSGYALQYHPPPPVAPQPNYQVHHYGPSSAPLQSGFASQHHPRPPVAPHQPNYQVHHLGPSVPSQSGYVYQHHQLPPVAPPQSKYQVHHRDPSSAPSEPGFAFQHHPRPPVAPYQLSSQVHHRPRPPIAPMLGHGSQNPQLPFAPHLGYGLEHQRPLAAPPQSNHGWQHHQSDQNLMFR